MNDIRSDTYVDFRKTVRQVATERIAPHAADVDERERFPAESWQAVVDAELPGLPHPEALGGSGADLMAQVIAIEEIATACMTTSHVLLCNWAGTCTILSQGSDDLQRLVVPQVASGQAGAGWCLTEPTAGSDVASLTTTATKVDGGWKINGQKRFISNAPWGDWYAVLARSSESTHGVFIVHRDDPGLSFGPHERKMGLRGSPTADVILTDCVVPDIRVVGDSGNGYRYVMAELNASRALIAAQALGVAQGAFNAAVAYTSERSQFGQAISRFQMVRGMVADIAVRLAAARALLYEAVGLIEAGHPDARAKASMAKLLCSDNAMAVTTDAVQLFGGYGFTRDYPVERMMRDAKITQIYEGTNQIQRMLIAKAAYAGMRAS